MKKLFAGIGGAAVLASAVSMNVLAAQITAEEAKNIAMNHAQVDSSQIAYIIAQQDFENGRMIYDVEFFTNDFREYDYEIGMSDGAILSYDFDAETAFLMNSGAAGTSVVQPYGQTGNPAITADQAKAVALQQAGLNASQVSYIEAHLDYDDGWLLYEGKFFYGAMEYEFKVDSSTGALIDWDVESIYD